MTTDYTGPDMSWLGGSVEAEEEAVPNVTITMATADLLSLASVVTRLLVLLRDSKRLGKEEYRMEMDKIDRIRDRWEE